MSGITDNYTTFTHGKPLNEQLEKLGTVNKVSIDVGEMILNAPPLEISTVNFKPLQINDRLFKFTLTSTTSCKMTNQGMGFYDKLTFTIIDQNDHVLYSNVSTKHIEETVEKIYQSTKK